MIKSIVFRVFLPLALLGFTLPSGSMAAVDLQSMTPPHGMGQAEQPALNPGFSGKIIEVLKASRYVYVQVDTGSAKRWAACPSVPVEVGDQVRVPAGMVMTDFVSPELGKVFSEVYFVGRVETGKAAASTPGAMPPAAAMPAGHPAMPAAMGKDGHPPMTMSGKAAAPLSFDGLTKPEGGFTVAEIFAQSASLSGKTVSFRGKVAKVNNNIMNRNWVHVQDGTGQPGTSNDLVVTTKDTVKVGDTVLVQGTLGTDADFGHGYTFAVIVEKATLTAGTAKKNPATP